MGLICWIFFDIFIKFVYVILVYELLCCFDKNICNCFIYFRYVVLFYIYKWLSLIFLLLVIIFYYMFVNNLLILVVDFFF